MSRVVLVQQINFIAIKDASLIKEGSTFEYHYRLVRVSLRVQLKVIVFGIDFGVDTDSKAIEVVIPRCIIPTLHELVEIVIIVDVNLTKAYSRHPLGNVFP